MLAAHVMHVAAEDEEKQQNLEMNTKIFNRPTQVIKIFDQDSCDLMDSDGYGSTES